jgi:hypothetical protein
LEGSLTASGWHLNGRAFEPSTWKLAASGIVQNLFFESELVPGPVHSASGRFDWQDRTIRYQSAKGTVSRSEITGLAVEADWEGPPRVDLRALELDASLEDISRLMQSFPKTAAYAAELAPVTGTARMADVTLQTRLLPGALILDRFKAVLKDSVISSAPIGLPLTLAAGEFDLQGSKLALQIAEASLGKSQIRDLSVSGDWSSGGGLDLSADGTVVECGEIFPRLILLAGLEGLRENVAGLQGTIQTPHVRLKGPLREPRRWRVQADAEFKDIVVATTFLDDPIELPMGRLAFVAAEGPETGAAILRLDSIRVRIGTDAAALSGDVALAAADTALHLDILADALDWDKIERLSDRFARHRQTDSRPVRGRLNLRAERLAIDRFQFGPVHAQARLAPEGTRIEIERAGFCGMTFIGRMTFEGPMVEAYLVPVVDVMPLDGVIACLSDEKSLFSGTFNLDGAIGFKARREDIVRALNGRLTLVAEDGTIRQSALFARIFALLNLTEIYRGRLPDFNSQGLDYKRSTAVIEAKEGKLLVSDWSIDGRTLWFGSRGEIDIATQQIDFTIMVSPFKTIDRIINSIPGLRWVLGGRLIAIPMRASGTLDDPQVVPLSPSAVGTSILEMIERTLLLPIEIIQPLVPGMQATPSGTISR